jgi:hypothetical protein
MNMDVNNIQFVVDEWEGNTTTDDDILIEGGVKAKIVRLNSMNGGLHMDDEFEEKWKTAKKYKYRSIYCVFNPWVDGDTNFHFFNKNLPLDSKGIRVFMDVEVRYSEITPEKYASEMFLCKKELEKYNKVSVYSCQGLLDICSRWPTDDWWWAAYPLVLYGNYDWNELRNRVSKLDFCPNKNKCPGAVKLWQCIGDYTKIYGAGGHAEDVSIFNGTEEELGNWLGYDNNNLGNSSDSSSGKDSSEITENGLFQVKVKTATLNIRSGPGIEYNKIIGSTYKMNDIINVMDVSGKDVWYKTEKGWIAGIYGGNEYSVKIS